MTLTVDRSGSMALSPDDQRSDEGALPSPVQTLGIVSLFSGIAGLDSGMETSSAQVLEMCESWAPARRVLQAHYPSTHVAADVSKYLPRTDFEVLTAGFPCTDLSHVGSKAGIFGPQSGLVEHVFRIARVTRPEWIVLENVPNLLTLHQGAGITEVVGQLEELGYSWAYRTVDSRFTGVPQRRYRVIVLASAVHDPTGPLFGEDVLPLGERLRLAETTRGSRVSKPKPQNPLGTRSARPHGFYWTEGRNGLGLVEGSIPTLKGGSMLGLPSAPAIWFPGAPIGHRFVLPRIEDGEVLQGFPVGWTSAAVVPGERDLRWKLLGNAVTRGVGAWIGDRLATATSDEQGLAHPIVTGRQLSRSTRWPMAATGGPRRTPVEVIASDHPRILPMTPLEEIVDVEAAPPLSYRATRGFLSRLDEKQRRTDPGLYADLELHLAATRPKPLPAGEQSGAPSLDGRAGGPTLKRDSASTELRMRRALTALGLRYQLETRPESDLRCRLDIVFKGAKVAVDLRGCFWHSCPDHGASGRPSAERWAGKLQRTRDRDQWNVEHLTERGWIVCVVWEHDDVEVSAKEIAALVGQRQRKRAITSSGSDR